MVHNAGGTQISNIVDAKVSQQRVATSHKKGQVMSCELGSVSLQYIKELAITSNLGDAADEV